MLAVSIRKSKSYDANFNDLEWPQTLISRSRHYSKFNISQMIRDRRTVRRRLSLSCSSPPCKSSRETVQAHVRWRRLSDVVCGVEEDQSALWRKELRLQYRVGRVAKNHHWQVITFAECRNTWKFDRGLTHLLHSELHWFGVPQRILHKLRVTVPRCLQGKAPQYLVNCCHPTSDVASRQRLRYSSRHHLVVPRHRRSTLGRRTFSVAGLMAWNALPDDIRDPSLSADNFRKTLKTHLFRNALGYLAH